MKTSAIICEYNPFHNGHAYQICKAKELGAEKIIAIMSGNLVQRGEPAICDKFSRAKTALMGGADLVVELPSVFSMSNAESFAKAGVFIANELGADSLIFGSECGDIKKLTRISENLSSPSLDEIIKTELKKGNSYSAARCTAYELIFGECPELKNSNDILGVEYISAIKTLSADIEPVCIKRNSVQHDSGNAVGEFASASHIRDLIREGKLDEAEKYIPKQTAFMLRENLLKGKISDIKNIEAALLSKIRTATAKEISSIPDIADGLDFRLYNASRKASSFDELINMTKTKCFTMARIKRAVLSFYFGIEKNGSKHPEYIRVLGLNSNGEKIIKSVWGKTAVPIVMRGIELKDNEMFKKECNITDLYSLSYKKPAPCGSELTSRVGKI